MTGTSKSVNSNQNAFSAENWTSSSLKDEQEYPNNAIQSGKRHTSLLLPDFKAFQMNYKDRKRKQKKIAEKGNTDFFNLKFGTHFDKNEDIFKNLNLFRVLFFFFPLDPLSSFTSSSSFLSSSYFFVSAKIPTGPSQSSNSLGKSSRVNSQKKNSFRRSFSQRLNLSK